VAQLLTLGHLHAYDSSQHQNHFYRRKVKDDLSRHGIQDSNPRRNGSFHQALQFAAKYNAPKETRDKEGRNDIFSDWELANASITAMTLCFEIVTEAGFPLWIVSFTF
jgi:hypothetical protein